MSQLRLFSEESTKSLLALRFEQTELGRLRSCLPIKELASLFPKKKNRGVKGILDIEGGIALQFLKSYLGLSDAKLIARLNTDWCLQLFCGVQFGQHTWINDKDYVGRWRRALATHLDIKDFQAILVKEWRDSIEDQHAVFMDATCYESHVRLPTNEKLLWESIEWVYEKMYEICKTLKCARPRSRYKEKRLAYLNFARTKQKTHKKKQKLRKKLLYLLEQGLDQLSHIMDQGKGKLYFNHHFMNRLEVIKKVLEQQNELHQQGQTAGKSRIVSLSKPYLRPIVRGKESKRVEYGVKAHLLLVGGIGLIEELSFNAFHEGIRLEEAVRLHESYFEGGRMLGADRIYGTRSNRQYCKQKGITTSFIPLGRPPISSKNASAKVARRALNKVRSTALEGAFGNQKQHYNLGRIKAKTAKTELLWIAFGIWTASAMKIAQIRASNRGAPAKTTLKKIA